MEHLGLGGYGTDEDEAGSPSDSSQQPEVTAGPPIASLLDSYTSAEHRSQELLEPVGLPGGGDESGGAGDEPEQSPEAGPSKPDENYQDVDSWLSFLPQELRQPPPGPCNPTAEARLRATVETSKKLKRSFIESLRSNRTYSNPDLLRQLVKTYDLTEHGSAFDPAVFDPSALPADDYIDALINALTREQERRQAVRAAAPPGTASIAFERGPVTLGGLGLPGLPGLPRPGSVGALINTAQLQAQAQKAAEALQQQQGVRKRSKWDSAT